MSMYELPESAEIGGREYRIRSDFRAVLDVMQVMADPELDDDERALLALSVFYEGFEDMPARDFQEAVDYCMWFVAGGREPERGRKPRLMDWEQDFPLIVAPVNHVLGYEARSAEHLHWWTFLAAYNEIGDCTFAQVVSIRKQKQQGKKLSKQDDRFYRENKALVDLRLQATREESDLFDEWIGA